MILIIYLTSYIPKVIIVCNQYKNTSEMSCTHLFFLVCILYFEHTSVPASQVPVAQWPRGLMMRQHGSQDSQVLLSKGQSHQNLRVYRVM